MGKLDTKINHVPHLAIRKYKWHKHWLKYRDWETGENRFLGSVSEGQEGERIISEAKEMILT